MSRQDTNLVGSVEPVDLWLPRLALRISKLVRLVSDGMDGSVDRSGSGMRTITSLVKDQDNTFTTNRDTATDHGSTHDGVTPGV